jgi:hypothetical protein
LAQGRGGSFKEITVISITAIDTAVSSGAADGALVPLSDRFNEAFARYYVQAGHERDGILAAANDPMVAADPQQLYQLQLRQEAYTKQVTLTSALVGHATKGIETLVKS